MAKMQNFNQDNQFQRTQQQYHYPQKEEKHRDVFKISWLLVPLSILGMWYLLSNFHAVLKWNDVMSFLGISRASRERYSMMAILCLTMILIVASVRIFGRKNRE